VRELEEQQARERAEEEQRLSREAAEHLVEETAVIAEIGRVIGSSLDIDYKLSDPQIAELDAQAQRRLDAIRTELVGQMESALRDDPARVGLIKGWREWLMPWKYLGKSVAGKTDKPWTLSSSKGFSADSHPVLKEVVRHIEGRRQCSIRVF